MRLSTDTADRQEPLGDHGTLGAATTLAEHLVLIDERQPYQVPLKTAHGLTFLDPYAR